MEAEDVGDDCGLQTGAHAGHHDVKPPGIGAQLEADLRGEGFSHDGDVDGVVLGAQELHLLLVAADLNTGRNGGTFALFQSLNKFYICN